MSAILERIQQAEAASKQAAAESYEQLARQISSGTDDPTFDDVQQILGAAGKNATDLAALVSYHQQRNGWREQRAIAAEALAERTAIQEKIDAVGRELKAAQQKHDETVIPLFQRVRQINDLISQSASAEQQLRSGCKDEALLTRQRRNLSDLQQLAREVQTTREQLERQRSALRAANGHQGNWDVQVDANPEHAAEYAGRVERLQTQLSELEKKQEAILAEGKRLAQQTLEV